MKRSRDQPRNGRHLLTTQLFLFCEFCDISHISGLKLHRYSINMSVSEQVSSIVLKIYNALPELEYVEIQTLKHELTENWSVHYEVFTF